MLPALLGAAVLWWGASTILADFGGDNAIYWLTANFWSPWGGEVAAAEQFARGSIYPPLYPLVLAVTGGGNSILLAHLVSAGFVALALFAIRRFAMRLGLPAGLALLVVVAFLATRITVLEIIQLHSEHLYLLLSFAALAITAQTRPSRGALYLAAACIGAAYLTRTFGIALVVAFALALILTRPPGHRGAMVIVLAPVLGWHLLGDGNARYLHQMLGLYEQAGVGPRLAANFEWLWRKWLLCFSEPTAAGFVAPFALAVGGAAIVGALMRVRELRVDGFYALATLAMIVLWPYPAEYERFFYTLLPVLYAHAFYAAYRLGRNRSAALGIGAPALLATFLFASQLPFLMLFAERQARLPGDPADQPFRRSVAWYYHEPDAATATVAYQRGLLAGYEDVRIGLAHADGGCLLAIKPSIAAFYTGLRSEGMPAADTPANMLQALRDKHCELLFMTLASSPSFPEAFYPYQRLVDHLEILEVYPIPGNYPAPAAILARLPTP